MAYSFPEFPHTNYSDYDLREIIELYKSLKLEYDGIRDSIRTLTERLNQYERDIESRLDAKANNAVQPLRTQVANEIQSMRQDLTGMVQNIDIRNTQKIEDGLRNVNSSMNDGFKVITAKVNDLVKEVEKDFTEYESYIDSQLSSGLDNISNTTHNSIDVLKENMQVTYTLFQQQVADLMDKINPVALWDNVYQMFGFDAVEWYNFTDVTCEEWNSSGVTCAQWYVNGKNIFDYEKEQSKVLNPLTGEIEELKDIVLHYILDSMPQRMTAKQFDNLRLTAEAFDKLMLTAKEYDLKGEYNDFQHNKKFKPSSV